MPVARELSQVRERWRWGATRQEAIDASWPPRDWGRRRELRVERGVMVPWPRAWQTRSPARHHWIGGHTV